MGRSSGPAELQAIGDGLAETAAELGRARAAEAAAAAELAERNRQLSEVLRLAREVAGSLNLRYVLRGVCTAATAVTGARVVVWTRNDGRVEPCADSDGPDQRPVGIDAVKVGEGPVGRAARFGRLVSDDESGKRSIAVPMVVGAEVIGVLEFPNGRGMTLDTLAVLETLAVHAATAIEAARMHQHTAELAQTDVLTGLPNRRRLNDDLTVACAAAHRYDRALTLLMVDVDHFKAYNDEFGHQAGDVALQEVGRLLANLSRSSDVAYRYGGEEFVILAPETVLEEGLAFAERVRAAVEQRFADGSLARPVTVSIGVAALPRHGPSQAALLAAADVALYEAKRGGRNRVVQAAESAAVLPGYLRRV